MSFLKNLFAPEPEVPPLDALWRAVVARARDPRWYTAGGVPDTLDGRFDAVALVLSLVLVRLEREDDTPAQVILTERFVDDMDGNLRQLGIGDMVVGKHVGRMMGALGGRLGAYRAALDAGGDLDGALVRNLYRGAAPHPDALAWTASEVRRLAAAIDAAPLEPLMEGALPA
jgi:cytochrome b pre-mRNA-processing protein 3